MLVTTAASVVLSAFQGARAPCSRSARSRSDASQIVALDVVVDKGTETESTQGFVKEELPDYMKVASPLHGTAEAPPGRPSTHHSMHAPESRYSAPNRAASARNSRCGWPSFLSLASPVRPAQSKRRMYPSKCDVMDEIESFVQEQIDAGLLLNQEKAWQPHDFLPDSEKPTEEWIDEASPRQSRGGSDSRVPPVRGSRPGSPTRFPPPLLPRHLGRQPLWRMPRPSPRLPPPRATFSVSFPSTQVRELRERAAGVSDELMLVLIGDMITEEALPTYLTLLNTLEGTDDPTGAVDTAWGRWSRQWTAEENRHGDLLNRYLYLSGRVDMRSIELTIMKLISSGFDPDTRSDPYRGFIYTSFQERATKISHGNVGKLAAAQGDPVLARICARIAGDEARHEKAYQLFVQRVLELDPDGAMISYKDMMQKQIVMPAELMADSQGPVYDDFSRVATDLKVYTGVDYADIITHLNDFWQIDQVTGLCPEAQEAQEYLMKLPNRFTKLAQRQEKSLAKTPRVPRPWPWLHNRPV